jgi:hypothetical protein
MEETPLLDSLREKFGNKNLLIHKKQIMIAIEEGYALKNIWLALKDRHNIAFSYSGFVKKVRGWQHQKRHKRQATIPHEIHSNTAPLKTTPKELKSDSPPPVDKKKGIFDNWTGENLSAEDLYGKKS